MQILDTHKHAIASLSILITVLVLFYAIIIHPAISSRMQFRERYEELQFQLNKLDDSESRYQQLQKDLEQLGSQETDQTGFLENKPEALAAADLQKHIKVLIESSAGDLISTQVVQQKELDIFPHIIVKVHLRGTIEALRNILYRLNTDTRILLVNNLFIQKRNSSGERRGQHGGDQLEVRFDVTGFIYQAAAS